MKKMIIFISIIVVIFAALIFVVNYQNSQKIDEANNPYGTTDLDQATIDQIGNENYQNQIMPDELEEKLSNGEDVTVYFYSPTCSYCQQTTPVIVPLTEDLGVDLVKMNLLEFAAPGHQHNIQSTPTIVHFENGEESARIVGAQSEANFEAFFQQEVLGSES